MCSTRCSPVAAFSLLLLCRCFRTGAQPVGGVEGGNDSTPAAAFEGQRPLVGGGEKVPYAGRMERINFTGGLSVEVIVPLVYAGPWLGPAQAVAAVVVIGVLACVVGVGHVLTCIAALGEFAAKDVEARLRLANDPDATLWYELRSFVVAVLLLPWMTLAISWALPWLQSASPLCVAGIAAAAQVCAERRWLTGALTGAGAWRSLLSKLEALDACTDGAVVLVACSLDEVARRRFVESCKGNNVTRLLAERVGVGGLFLAALSYATALQACSHGAALVSSALSIVDNLPRAERGVAFSSLAYACGLGALVVELREESDARVKLISGMSRTFAETMPQLFLQTSLLMATDASLLSQPLLAMSLLASCGAFFAKTYEVASIPMRACARRAQSGEWSGEWWLCFVVLTSFSLIMGALNIVLWARIYYSEACASREWGLTTGCLELAE